MTPTVGQELWYVPEGRGYGRRGEGRAVFVTRVGRKWADVEVREGDRHYAHGRIDIKSLSADGGHHSSPGRCYLSVVHYELEKARETAWQQLRRGFDHRYRAPDGVTIEQIIQAAQLLGIDIMDKKDAAE